jgi:hypothetical protein
MGVLYRNLIIAGWVSVAIAQSPKPPYALFEQSTLTGSGNTINATQIPVVTATGAVVYLNLALQFNVDANGNLTMSSGFPQVSAAPTMITGGFKAGTYVSPSSILGGKGVITVTGPGVTNGGATLWTLTAGPGAAQGTYPSNATWYAGPITSNPLASAFSRYNITSTIYSYGQLGSGSSGAWSQGTLIGVSQVGNTITFYSYYSIQNIPTDQITYTLAPTQ